MSIDLSQADNLWRRDVLGGSDAPAIVGVDPFRTAGDLWYEKTGRLPPRHDPGAAAAGQLGAAALGSAIAPLLLDVAEHRLRRPIAREVWYRHPELPLAFSADGLALDAPAVLVEGKTAGLLGHGSQLLAAYGDDETDEVPESVLIQIHHGFGVLDAQPEIPRVDVALVVALLGGRGLHRYIVRRDPQLLAELLELEAEWWERYVVGDVCPPDDPPSLSTLRVARRRPELAAVPVADALVGEWLEAKAALKRADADEETARRLLLTALGDAELGSSSYGRVSYKASERAEYTVKAQTVRTLRFQVAKEGKAA